MAAIASMGDIPTAVTPRHGKSLIAQLARYLCKHFDFDAAWFMIVHIDP
jgi:hypothetical protein